MPALTVVVPSYNHARFVERTLRSIFAQTRLPEKLIVIDDGSQDESVAVIETVLADSPIPCELRARENRGLSATLNEGFAQCETEFFAYLGSDDVWLRDLAARQIALLGSRPDAALAFSHAYLIDEDDNIIDDTAKWTEFADGDMLPLLLRGQIFSSPGVVYRRSALDARPWNENSILEDYELYLRLAGAAPFARNEEILCGWRQHGTNVSRDFPRMLNEWIAAQDRVAGTLGIGRDELNKVQRELKFEAVASLVRHGHRRDAWRMFRENLRGSRSVSRTAEMLLRLVTPRTLFEMNRRRKRQASIRANGKLKI